MVNGKNKKICIVCSAGGHLTELKKLLPYLKKHEIVFFTFRIGNIRSVPKKYKTIYTINPSRNIFKFFKVIKNSISFLKKEKPKVIISSGGGVAVPLCTLAKLLNKKLIFIETSSRIDKPSITGKILYPFANLFFVQWKSLLKKYGKKAIYGGLLI